MLTFDIEAGQMAYLMVTSLFQYAVSLPRAKFSSVQYSRSAPDDPTPSLRPALSQGMEWD